MRRYTAETYREDDGFWFIQIRELGIATQAYERDGVEFMARDLLAVWLEVDVSEVAVEVVDVPRPEAVDEAIDDTAGRFGDALDRLREQ